MWLIVPQPLPPIHNRHSASGLASSRAIASAGRARPSGCIIIFTTINFRQAAERLAASRRRWRVQCAPGTSRALMATCVAVCAAAISPAKAQQPAEPEALCVAPDVWFAKAQIPFPNNLTFPKAYAPGRGRCSSWRTTRQDHAGELPGWPLQPRPISLRPPHMQRPICPLRSAALHQFHK